MARSSLSEAEFRIRPWLKLTDCEFVDNSHLLSKHDCVLFKFENIGALPAEEAELEVLFQTDTDTEQLEKVDEINRERVPSASGPLQIPKFPILFPGEQSEYILES